MPTPPRTSAWTVLGDVVAGAVAGAIGCGLAVFVVAFMLGFVLQVAGDVLGLGEPAWLWPAYAGVWRAACLTGAGLGAWAMVKGGREAPRSAEGHAPNHRRRTECNRQAFEAAVPAVARRGGPLAAQQRADGLPDYVRQLSIEAEQHWGRLVAEAGEVLAAFVPGEIAMVWGEVPPEQRRHLLIEARSRQECDRELGSVLYGFVADEERIHWSQRSASQKEAAVTAARGRHSEFLHARAAVARPVPDPAATPPAPALAGPTLTAAERVALERAHQEHMEALLAAGYLGDFSRPYTGE